MTFSRLLSLLLYYVINRARLTLLFAHCTSRRCTIFISKPQSRPRGKRFSSSEGGGFSIPMAFSRRVVGLIAVHWGAETQPSSDPGPGFHVRQRWNHQFLDYSKHSLLFYYKMRTTETSACRCCLMLSSICRAAVVSSWPVK